MKTKIAIRSFPIIGYGTKDLVWTVSLTLAAIIAPALLAHTPHNQWITGTIVNALLFIAAWKLGIANSLFVAAMPSSIALLRGLLPAPMAFLVPFIIISNLLLIIVFSSLRKNIALGIFISSLTKFIFLFGISSYFAIKLAAPLIVMMQWPQLITALAGGFVAYGAINILKNRQQEK